MTARDGFELLLASWLEDAGPLTIDGEVVDRAIATANLATQRRGIAAALAGPSPWPRTRPVVADFRVVVRAALLLALALLAIAGAVFVGSQRHDRAPLPGPIGTVTTVDQPSVPRNGAVLVRLANGRVAVAGGVEIRPAPLELFDPATGTFATRAALDLPGGGAGFALPNGNVLFVMFDANNVRAYAEIVNPATGELVGLPATATLHLSDAAAARLEDGRILFAGGNATQAVAPPFSVPLAAAEIFDPVTNRFARTGPMHSTREGHSAATLADGRVLVAGGDGRNDAEVLDPATGMFGEPIAMPSVRAETISVALPNGTVAVFRGGLTVLNPDRPATDTPVDIFDPATNTFREAAPVPFEPSAAAVLADGRVFLGTFHGGLVYDPATGTTATTKIGPIDSGSVVTLADGGVLVVGSSGTDELGTPVPAPTEVFRP
jgi:hypothetical protein